MPDDVFAALFAEVTAGGRRFGHREHVHLTWQAVRRCGMPDAIDLVSAGIRRTARYAGAPQKYHATISQAWVEVVAHHAGATPRRPVPAGGPFADQTFAGGTFEGGTFDGGPFADRTFEAFADANPELLDKRLLSRFYSSALLASPHARTGWVLPDREPFPFSPPPAAR